MTKAGFVVDEILLLAVGRLSESRLQSERGNQ